jgi:hypothetical protein
MFVPLGKERTDPEMGEDPVLNPEAGRAGYIHAEGLAYDEEYVYSRERSAL